MITSFKNIKSVRAYVQPLLAVLTWGKLSWPGGKRGYRSVRSLLDMLGSIVD
jgi:hypothetical protein